MSSYGLTGFFSVQSLAWSPDGSSLAFTRARGDSLELRESDSGLAKRLILRNHYVENLRWSPSGKWIATDDGQSVQLWDTASEATEPVSVFAGPIGLRPDDRVSVTWSPDGQLLAAAYDCGGVVRFFDPAVMTQFAECGSADGMRDERWSVAWSPDSRRLAVLRHQEVQLWDPVAGRKTLVLTASSGVQAVAWSPDAHHLAAVARDGTLNLWTAGGEHLASLHVEPVVSLAWPQEAGIAVQWPDGRVGMFQVVS
jgi:WD40 repeat protein